MSIPFFRSLNPLKFKRWKEEVPIFASTFKRGSETQWASELLIESFLKEISNPWFRPSLRDSMDNSIVWDLVGMSKWENLCVFDLLSCCTILKSYGYKAVLHMYEGSCMVIIQTQMMPKTNNDSEYLYPNGIKECEILVIDTQA